ncbi:two-component system regulatory protein YycI [Niallia sp. 01092]|uniref:two-component system regulatory protein YycI n=1 Tax=unclassified Niallia TaxID=2837522 RepID=UPI003FCFEEC4
MDWNKIKTIFIIAFFVLDIYLIYEYTDLKQSQHFDNREEASVENTLASNDISYNASALSKSGLKDQYLAAKSKIFSNEEVKKWKQELLKGQEITIIDGNILQSILENPISLSDPFKQEDLTDFIHHHVMYGDQYRYWEKTDNTVTYYQQYNEKMLYQNSNGKLTFFLNQQNKVVSYNQTYLENIKEIGEKEALSRPVDAIYTLFMNSYIDNGSDIKDVEFGYYSQQQSSSTQVLSPAWRVIGDNGKNLFVKAFAFDRQIIKINSEQDKLE